MARGRPGEATWGDMKRPREPALALRPTGLRFERPETERAYRRWHTSSAQRFARIGYVGSAPSWLLLLVAVLVLDPAAGQEAGGWIGAWIALLVLLTALSFPPALERTVMPLAALANCVAGFLIVWLLSDVVLLDQLDQSRAGVMTAGLIVVMFFGFAVFRIPPGVAVLAVTPYVAFGTQRLVVGFDDRLNGVETASLAAAQWIAYLGCLLVCVVMEILDRRTFRADQVIQAQQRELRESRETIRRYVPRPVFECIARGEGASVVTPARRRVTVLFADLVGFTVLADRVEAEVLERVVNDYMTTMSQVVDEHGGIVNEFAGDGLMALFGAPDPMEPGQQAASAVRAAQAMQARLPGLNQAWHRLGAPEPLRTRIGINTGVLSVGSFGSEGRMTYTAIGLQTNVAARLQAHCEPGSILISDATWFLVKDEVPCAPRGEVACKGVHFPVRVYAPVLTPSATPASALARPSPARS